MSSSDKIATPGAGLRALVPSDADLQQAAMVNQANAQLALSYAAQYGLAGTGMDAIRMNKGLNQHTHDPSQCPIAFNEVDALGWYNILNDVRMPLPSGADAAAYAGPPYPGPLLHPDQPAPSGAARPVYPYNLHRHFSDTDGGFLYKPQCVGTILGSSLEYYDTTVGALTMYRYTVAIAKPTLGPDPASEISGWQPAASGAPGYVRWGLGESPGIPYNQTHTITAWNLLDITPNTPGASGEAGANYPWPVASGTKVLLSLLPGLPGDSGDTYDWASASDWDPDTGYAVDEIAIYKEEYWRCIAAASGTPYYLPPDTHTANWCHEPYRIGWFTRRSRAGQMFPVYIESDGGTTLGSASTVCDYTYAAWTEDERWPLGTSLTPTRARPTATLVLPASGGGTGTGYYDEDFTFYLHDASEWIAPSGAAGILYGKAKSPGWVQGVGADNNDYVDVYPSNDRLGSCVDTGATPHTVYLLHGEARDPNVQTDQIIAYMAGPDGEYMALSDYGDDAIGTIKAWPDPTTIPAGWDLDDSTVGRFIAGLDADEVTDDWEYFNVVGIAQNDNSCAGDNQHTHTSYNPIDVTASGVYEINTCLNFADHLPPYIVECWIHRKAP
jgi:hypothetical protein